MVYDHDPFAEAEEEVELEMCPYCRIAGVLVRSRLVCPTCKTILLDHSSEDER